MRKLYLIEVYETDGINEDVFDKWYVVAQNPNKAEKILFQKLRGWGHDVSDMYAKKIVRLAEEGEFGKPDSLIVQNKKKRRRANKGGQR